MTSGAKPALERDLFQPSLTGTNRIIQNYLDHGGAAMDEGQYQLYRAAMLERWLDTMYERLDSWTATYRCPECNDDASYDVDQAIAHIRVHRPQYFEGGA